MNFKRFLSSLLSIAILVLPFQFPTSVEAKRVKTTHQLIASGTVTLTNMRISAVDGGATASGGAFVDFGVADVLTGKLGCLLVVKDSAGNKIQGIIKAAGTGETLSGVELVTNGGFDLDATWIKSEWTISGGKGVATAIATEKYIYQVITTTVRRLYKNSVIISDYVAGIVFINAHDGVPSPNYNSDGTKTFYHTRPSTGAAYADVENIGVTTLKIDDYSVQQVLTPSITGVTIVSTKGGATYNFTNKSSSFNYYDASGYKYEIYRTPAVIVDSDPCTNANATINLADGSATWSCTGIDDSAYLDGRNIIAIYDDVGVGAFGYYKSAGAGAVVNTKGGATQNWIYIGSGFSTAGNFTRKVIFVGD